MGDRSGALARRPRGGRSGRARRGQGQPTTGRGRWLDGAAAVAGAALAVLVAVAWIPFRGSHSNVEVALFLVVVMTGVGVSGRRPAVIGSVVGAATAFTFFDTEPYQRFAISRQPDIETAVSLIVVGLLTGELAVRVARQHRSDQSATGDLSRVREASTLLALGEELVVLIGAVADQLIRALALRDCWFVAEGVPEGTLSVHRDGQLAGVTGAAEVALPVWGYGQVVGHFMLQMRPGATLRREQLLVAVTLADQVGAALAVQAPSVPPPPGPASPATGPVPGLRVIH